MNRVYEKEKDTLRQKIEGQMIEEKNSQKLPIFGDITRIDP